MDINEVTPEDLDAMVDGEIMLHFTAELYELWHLENKVAAHKYQAEQLAIELDRRKRRVRRLYKGRVEREDMEVLDHLSTFGPL